MTEVFNTFLVHPIINALIAIYQAFLFIHFPFALGFSIIALTILIRFLLYPLISSQLKASRKMQELNPHLAEIKERHKGNSTMISQETMRLYKEHGVNPAAGCLPVIIQLPIIWALYSVLQEVVKFTPGTVVNEINKIVYFDFLKLTKAWDPSFFGIPLGQTPDQLRETLGFAVLLIPILTGFFQFIQSKMMFLPPVQQNPEVKKKDDFSSVFASQSTYIFPVMIALFSWGFPIGLSLYWNTFTIFGIIQQHRISGWGNLSSLWIKK